MRPGLPARLVHYARWILACRLGGRRVPLTASLILTDRCNLHCRHCAVAHLGYPLRSYAEIAGDLGALYRTGARVLVITGGEPYEWRDGERGLEDVVTLGRRLGFFRIVVCTNGTHPLVSGADYLWVSLDGDAAAHEALRGDVYRRVTSHLAARTHARACVNFTVTALGAASLEAAAEHVLALPGVRRVMFHLFTPYLGSDPALRLDADTRAATIARLRRLKRRHPLRVSNTSSGLRELARNRWPRPIWSSVVVDRGVLSPCCCRLGIYDDAVCRACGCTPAVETYVLERLRPLAVLENLRSL
ncbi:MAG: radical SAM protein [Actinomycetota bacterium]